MTGRSDGGGCGAGSGREPTIHRGQQPRRRARHCAPTHHQPSESSKLSGARSFLSCAKVWRAVLRTGHEGGGGVGPPQLVLLQLLRVLPPKHPLVRAKHAPPDDGSDFGPAGAAGCEGVRTRSIRVAGECAAYGRGRLGFLDSSFNRLHAPPRPPTLRADSRRADDPGSGRDGPRRGRHGLEALSAREDVGAGAVHAQPLRPRRVCAQSHGTRSLSEVARRDSEEGRAEQKPGEEGEA